MATPLRALIAAIPHVGASIEGVFAGPSSKAAQPRLQFMFAELHREMRTLDESRVRKEVLETDAWSDIVRHAVALAATTRDTKRLSAIARVLAGTATGTVRLPGQPGALVEPAPHAGDEEVLLAMFG